MMNKDTTAIGTGLGELPLGSMQSRAVARLLLERKRGSEKREEYIIVILDAGTPSHASEWVTEKSGIVSRIIWVAPGALLADSLRIVGGYSEQDLEFIAKERPGKQESFEIFVLER
jgi:hypothetical protein